MREDFWLRDRATGRGPGPFVHSCWEVTALDVYVRALVSILLVLVDGSPLPETFMLGQKL